MLSRHSVVFCFTLFLIGSLSASAIAEVYELRTYTTNDGKLDDLNRRFRNHTCKLFEKHGIENVGYWVPTDEERSSNTLIYVVRHQDRESAKKSWKAFLADPDWQKAYRASEADGPILAKAPESVYMTATDYTPKYENDAPSEEGVFELRIYKTNDSKLSNLNARFRDHTIGLFEKHGIRSVAYWTPSDGDDASDTLIYIIRHESPDAAKKSWSGFIADPEWKTVAAESQKDGKLLKERPSATYMKATDYSALK